MFLEHCTFFIFLSRKITTCICIDLCTHTVAQIKQHAAGNLTGELRKVKDIAADFHNLAMKWKALNSQGMDLVTQISNIKIEKV